MGCGDSKGQVLYPPGQVSPPGGRQYGGAQPIYQTGYQPQYQDHHYHQEYRNQEYQSDKEPETEPNIEPEPVVKLEQGPQTETEPEPDIEPDMESDPEPDPEPDIEPDIDPELQPEQEPELQPEQEPELQPEQETELQPELKPEPELQPEMTRRKSLDSVDAICKEAVAGNMDIEFPLTAMIVRIFTSSTFTDTKVERNSLMERVYPKLKTYCQELGYEFQVVDMRWGVRDEATDDHLTSELCMREIKECQRLSTGPNFITFLSQKYGYRPFPPKIKASDFKKMLNAVECQGDKDLLSYWFVRDENSVPKQYLLQPIRTKLPHYADNSDQEKKKKDRDAWWEAFERMQIVLRQAASKSFSDPAIVHKYYWAVTEEEIYHGILQAENTDKTCHWFRRNIHDLKDNTKDRMARRFMDISGGVDEEALGFLTKLKNDLVPAKLPSSSISEYTVGWTENGIDTSISKEHAKYIDTFCEDFDKTLRHMIENGISERSQKEISDFLVLECIQHVQFGQKKSDQFHGRQTVLDNIKEMVTSESMPIVFCGEPGSGKTSLMAKVATEVKSWIPGCNVILRFLGTTAKSCTTKDMLSSVCQQMQRLNGHRSFAYQSIGQVVEQFERLLSSSVKPVVILLDSLDQLRDHGGSMKDWVPKKLKHNVKLIMSAIPTEELRVVPVLKKLLPSECFLNVPKIAESDISLIIKAWLQGSNRCLQPYQQEIVEKACKALPLPLYMKLVYDQAATWCSYTVVDESQIKSTVQETIHSLLDKTEKYHGKILVTRALSVITAAKNGLSVNEIEDVLSLDDVALNDVYQYHKPPSRRLPPLLWVRIQNDISDYLSTSGADGIQVIRWYHRQFTAVANERYLKDETIKKQIHHLLVEYFSGDWSDGVKKPFVDKAGAAGSEDRFVASQPYVISEEGDKTIYNLRKFTELPYHLTMAGDADRLKRDTLLNFTWIIHKIDATEYDKVLEDYEHSLSILSDEEIEIVHECLLSAKGSIVDDINTLPTKLTEGLMGKLTPGMDAVKRLVGQATRPGFDCLYTTQGKMVSAAVAQFVVDDRTKITIFNINENGNRLISFGEDMKLRMWDMKYGRQLEKYDLSHEMNECNDVVSQVKRLVWCNSDHWVIQEHSDKIVIRDLDSGTLVHTLHLDEKEPYSSHVWNESKLLAVPRASSVVVYDLLTLGEVSTINLPEEVQAEKEEGKPVYDFFGGCEDYIVRYWTNSTEAVIATIGPDSSIRKYTIMSPEEVKKNSITMAVSSGGILAISYYFYIDPVGNFKTSDAFMDMVDIRTCTKLHTFSGWQDSSWWAIYLRPVGPRSFVVDANKINEKTIMLVDLDTKVAEPAIQYQPSPTIQQLASTKDIIVLLLLQDQTIMQAVNVRKGAENLRNTKQSSALTPNSHTLLGMMEGSQRYALYTTVTSTVFNIWDIAERKTVRQFDTYPVKDAPNLFFSLFNHVIMSRSHVATVCPGETNKLVVVDLLDGKNKLIMDNVAHRCSDKYYRVVRVDSQHVAFIGPKANQISIVNINKKKVEGVMSYPEEEVIFASLIASENGEIGLVRHADQTIDQTSGFNHDKEETTQTISVYDLKEQKHVVDCHYTSKYDVSLAMAAMMPRGAVITPDGKYYVFNSYSDKPRVNLEVFTLRTGEKRNIPPLRLRRGVDSTAQYMAYSKVTNSLVTAYGEGVLAMWELDSLECIRMITVGQGNFLYMWPNSSGSMLAASDGTSVLVCDLLSGEVLMTYKPDSQVGSCMFTPEDRFLLVTSNDEKTIAQLCIHMGDEQEKLPHDISLEDHYLQKVMDAEEDYFGKPQKFNMELE